MTATSPLHCTHRSLRSVGADQPSAATRLVNSNEAISTSMRLMRLQRQIAATSVDTAISKESP